MAKDQRHEVREQRSGSSDVQALAERLFIQTWKPGPTGTSPEAFAAMCFQGASRFLKVAGRIREGQTPEEIINPPDNVTATPSV